MFLGHGSIFGDRIIVSFRAVAERALLSARLGGSAWAQNSFSAVRR